jgi:hypothetical protein
LVYDTFKKFRCSQLKCVSTRRNLKVKFAETILSSLRLNDTAEYRELVWEAVNVMLSASNTSLLDRVFSYDFYENKVQKQVWNFVTRDA